MYRKTSLLVSVILLFGLTSLAQTTSSKDVGKRDKEIVRKQTASTKVGAKANDWQEVNRSFSSCQSRKDVSARNAGPRARMTVKPVGVAQQKREEVKKQGTLPAVENVDRKKKMSVKPALTGSVSTKDTLHAKNKLPVNFGVRKR